MSSILSNNTDICFFSGGKTDPKPTVPQPNTPTTTAIPDPDETDSTDEPEPEPEPEPTNHPTTTTSTPLDPTKDACNVIKFDTITVIGGDLYFFKDG